MTFPLMPLPVGQIAGGPRDLYYGNTILLLHGDGAGGSTTFVDKAATTAPLTVGGNVQIDTSQSKFGGGSILFDGSADVLYSTDASYWDVGTQDYTWEFWMRHTTSLSGRFECLLDARSGSSSNEPFFQLDTNLFVSIFGSNRASVSAGTVTDGNWHHVALARASGSWRFFVDGTQRGSTYSNSGNLTTGALTLGRFVDRATSVGGTLDYSGWLDDIRITKGVARYTANFTPPSAPFLDR